MQVQYLPKPRTFHLQWHITDKCNWNCKHCYQTDDYLENELNIEGLFHILNQYIDIVKLWKIKGSINLTGGEPFLRKDFFELLERIHENRDVIPRVGVLTNGSFITREIARKLKILDISQVQLSLEGTKQTNDEIRDKDSFEKIINASKVLVEEGIHTVFSFTSSKKNYEDFLKVVELGKEIGVNRVWTDRLVPYGHGKQLKDDMLEPLQLKEYYESINKISKKLNEAGSNTIVPTHRSLYFLAAEDKMSHRGYICPAGERLTTVMPNGDVFPCRRLPIKVGNLMEQSFFEIWYGNDILWKLRDRNEVNQLCLKCEYFEKCMGGARCVTYAYCDSPFAPDPQCWKAFDTLPSQNELTSYKSDNCEKFSPRTKEMYPNFSESKQYLNLGENCFSQIENSSLLLTKERHLKITSENIQSMAENIINEKPNFIILSFQINESDINNKNLGKKINHFFQSLIDNKISFNLARPLPRCLFGFEYQKITQKFRIPTSCRDCLELFEVNKNGEIELCVGINGPKIKYMSNRNQIYEYFIFFHRQLKPNKKCKNCTWYLRRQCHGLCALNI